MFKNVSKDKAELRKEKAAAVSEPLNWFVETTNADASLNNSTLQGNGLIPMLVDSSDNDDSRSVSKVDINKHRNYQTEAGGDQNESVPSKSSSLKFKIKRVDTNQEKRVRFSEDLNLPAPPETETKKEFGPIWFSLIASNDRYDYFSCLVNIHLPKSILYRKSLIFEFLDAENSVRCHRYLLIT